MMMMMMVMIMMVMMMMHRIVDDDDDGDAAAGYADDGHDAFARRGSRSDAAPTHVASHTLRKVAHSHTSTQLERSREVNN